MSIRSSSAVSCCEEGMEVVGLVVHLLVYASDGRLV